MSVPDGPDGLDGPRGLPQLADTVEMDDLDGPGGLSGRVPASGPTPVAWRGVGDRSRRIQPGRIYLSQSYYRSRAVHRSRRRRTTTVLLWILVAVGVVLAVVVVPLLTGLLRILVL